MRDENIELAISKLKTSNVANGRKGVYVPNHPHCNNRGYVLLSRYRIEQYISRLLNENEEVHHKDENKTNDDIDNLEILSSGQHAFLHYQTGEKSFGKRKLDYDWIILLRKQGLGYRKISKITGYILGSVKYAIRKLERI